MRHETKQRLLSTFLLLVYLALLTWIVLFKLSLSLDDLPVMRNLNLIPYGASSIVNGQIDMKEIIYNVLIFVPLGLLLSMVMPKRGFMTKLFLIFAISVSFETMQYVWSIGGSDITDVINNTLGGFAGLILYDLLELIFRNRTRLNKVLNFLGVVIGIVSIAFLGYMVLIN